MSKCRACGHETQLDDAHRAGTQLMKNLPKDMSEIDSKKAGAGAAEEKKAEEPKDGKGAAEDGEASAEEDKKEKKKKKKKEAEEEEEIPAQEDGIKLDSEEIGKCS